MPGKEGEVVVFCILMLCFPTCTMVEIVLRGLMLAICTRKDEFKQKPYVVGSVSTCYQDGAFLLVMNTVKWSKYILIKNVLNFIYLNIVITCIFSAI